MRRPENRRCFGHAPGPAVPLSQRCEVFGADFFIHLRGVCRFATFAVTPRRDHTAYHPLRPRPPGGGMGATAGGCRRGGRASTSGSSCATSAPGSTGSLAPTSPRCHPPPLGGGGAGACAPLGIWRCHSGPPSSPCRNGNGPGAGTPSAPPPLSAAGAERDARLLDGGADRGHPTRSHGRDRGMVSRCPGVLETLPTSCR